MFRIYLSGFLQQDYDYAQHHRLIKISIKTIVLYITKMVY